MIFLICLSTKVLSVIVSYKNSIFVVGVVLMRTCTHVFITNQVFNPEKLPNLTSLNLRGNPFANESAESLLATIQTLKSLKSLQVSFLRDQDVNESLKI